MRDLNEIIDGMFVELLRSGSPLSDRTPQSVTYTLLRSIAASIQQLELFQEQQLTENDFITATGTDLDNYCSPFGVYRLQSKPTTGWVLVSSDLALDLIPGLVFTNTSNGAQYILNTAGIVSLEPNTEQAIPVVASGLGGQYGAVAGTTLYSNLANLSSVVVGYERKYDGAACGDLLPGSLAESDTSLRKRWFAILQAGGLLTLESMRTLLVQHPQVIAAQITNPQPGIVYAIIRATLPSPELIKDLEAMIRRYLIAAIAVVRIAAAQPLTIEIDVTALPTADLNLLKTQITNTVEAYLQTARDQRQFVPATLQLALSSLVSKVQITTPAAPLTWNELTYVELGSLYVNFRV
jgi:Baseplate J-like protein